MITITVEDCIYHIEFRHVRKDGRWPTLGRHAPIQAITTCAIITSSPHEPWQFTAIGNAICALGDAFSRRHGRLLAFEKAVTQCGALRAHREMLLAAYSDHDQPPCHEIRPQLTGPEKTLRWEAGWEKRKQREEARVARGQAAYRAAITDEGSAS